MDEQTYLKLADTTFARIEDMFEDVDAEDVDCERAGDVLTLTFKNGTKCIVNTQRPTRQIWLAAGVRAWHFVRDDGGRWIDEKDPGRELMATLVRVVKEQAGIDVVAAG
jgi:iron-sulfur cluster assembly protein CyaY